MVLQVPSAWAGKPVQGGKNVLFLSSYHPGYPTFFRQVEGIRSVLDPRSVHLDIECIDTKRFDPPEIQAHFHNLLTYKFSRLPAYDLILAGDDNALHYVLAHQEGLFKHIPIVFFGVNNRRLALEQNENPLVTGVVESVSLSETLTLMTRLQPDVRRIVAISDNTVSVKGVLDHFHAAARGFKSIQFSVLSLENLSFEELAEVLQTFGNRDAVLLLSAFVDRTGHRIDFGRALSLITENLASPLYHLWYHGMGQGVIGGKLISHFDQGHRAAEMALEILSGTPPFEVPVEADSPHHFVVDPEAMKAKGMSLSLIPSGVDRYQDVAPWGGPYGFYTRIALGGIGGISFLACVLAVIAFHRRRADEQVAQSELRFRRLTRHMEEVFCVGSMATREIQEISPAVEQVLGLSPSKVRRNPSLIREAIHEDDRESFFAYLVRLQSGQEGMEAIEFRMRDVKGRLRWIRFRGFSIEEAGDLDSKIAGMATDITDAKQEDTAMKALVETLAGRVEQDFFDGAVRQLCAFLGCDTAIIGEIREGNMVHTLAMVQDGYMKESMTYHLLGTPCFESMNEGVCIYPEGVRDRFPANTMLRQVGAEGYLGFPLRDHNGKIIGVMCALSKSRFSIPKRTQEVVAILAKGIANEMERLENEQEKKAMEISLIRSQKMEAIGTLAGGIAHDFNNILFPIMGYVQMMQEETAASSPHGRYLNKIHASSLRAKKLVNQILAFSRKGDQVFEPVMIPEVLTEVLELVRASLPATIDLRVDITGEILPVMGDATQIHQVVMNLVTNAYHAMEGRSGCIWVKLAPGDKAGPDGSCGVSLTIRDTGGGIDPSVMDCIFDPYFTTKPKEKGTGLGLAVVHGIVENHGGEIDVDSTLGVGTTFTVHLPCMETACIEESVSDTAPVPVGHEHILVVDDEEEVCMVEQMMLERLGYRVSVASSGREALEIISADPESVQLMLTDMTMPRMTGLQLVARVRDMGWPLPVLLCTGLKDAAQERTSKGLGVLGIVKKPVSMGELADQVRRALDAPGG
ncbi:ABC transporter substrate binding protein [Desulfoluna spongiiphila]|uniref:ABC transporter substrate binding protein n=1 Tax=Desulfoluna spongiiphila TaxID=419481 RepID=UPI001252CDC8|nr:ABC transporter substrate binding protein [Desulfoluna spongiiphila]VVS91177.1 pas fold-3 [Desulfoluna spongiiphila]